MTARYPLCVHRPPVQLSVASATPSHSRPPCLGSGAVHSRLRCLSQSGLHVDHSLHSLQLPSTVGIRYKCKSRTRDMMMHIWTREAKKKKMNTSFDSVESFLGFYKQFESGSRDTICSKSTTPPRDAERFCCLADLKHKYIPACAIQSPFHLKSLSALLFFPLI